MFGTEAYRPFSEEAKKEVKKRRDRPWNRVGAVKPIVDC
jgi:hypothetical protein